MHFSPMRFMRFASVLSLVLLLALCLSGCSTTGSAKQVRSTCEKNYADPVYQSFCVTSLTIASAKKVIADYDASINKPSDLPSWKASVDRAEKILAHAESVYAGNGEIVELDSFVNFIEGWLYAD